MLHNCDQFSNHHCASFHDHPTYLPWRSSLSREIVWFLQTLLEHRFTYFVARYVASASRALWWSSSLLVAFSVAKSWSYNFRFERDLFMQSSFCSSRSHEDLMTSLHQKKIKLQLFFEESSGLDNLIAPKEILVAVAASDNVRACSAPFHDTWSYGSLRTVSCEHCDGCPLYILLPSIWSINYSRVLSTSNVDWMFGLQGTTVVLICIKVFVLDDLHCFSRYWVIITRRPI